MCCNNCTLDDGVDFGSLFKFDWNSTGYGDGNCFGECCGMILFFIIKMIFVLIIVILVLIGSISKSTPRTSELKGQNFRIGDVL